MLALGTAACGPGTPGGAEVAWAGGYCGVALTFVETTRATPLPQPDPPAQARALDDHLESSLSALDRAAADLARLGPSPVHGGDEAATGLGDRIRRYREAYGSARAAVDALRTRDAEAVRAGLPAALAPLGRLRVPNDDGLRTTPELDSAAALAPACDQLRGATAATTGS